MESNERDNRRVGVTITIAVGGIVLAAIAWVAGDVGGRNLEASMERHWDSTIGSREELLRHFPRRAADSLALDVERLAATLGQEIAPVALADRPRPTGAALGGFRRIKAPLGGWLTSRLERERREAGAPPEAVARWLEEHRETLDELRELLIAGIPRWERDLELGPAAPEISLLGMIELQKVLLADALSFEARGENVAAVEAVEASWNLATDLRETPNLVALLTGMTMSHFQAAALRQLRTVPPEWADRLRGQDWMRALGRTLDAEGRSLVDRVATDDPSLDDDDGPLEFVIAPYRRLCRADLGASWIVGLSRVASLPRQCDDDLSFLSTEARPSRWNALRKVVWSELGDVARRAAHTEFDLELTAAVVEATHGSRASTPSRVCPGASWTVTADGGTREVSLSRETDWPNDRRPVVPNRFTF